MALYVAVLLPVLIGMGVTAIDFSRLSTLNTFMQAGADALALAGAAELDGQSQPNGDDSITLANRAIANLVINKQRLGDAGKVGITVASTTFLTALPTADSAVIPAGLATTDPTKARYVSVKVTTANLTTIFPVTFLGAVSNTASTKAVATAGGPLGGAGRQLCLGPVVPMFICNPYESLSPGLFEVMERDGPYYATYRRKQILLQTGGNGSFAPGNFGWLDTPENGQGAGGLRDAISLNQPNSGGTSCRVSRNTISQRTGNVANADDATNTRFDLWSGPFNNASNSASYPPAQNVRKGWKPGNGAKGACTATNVNIDPVASPNLNNKLGRDSSFTGRIGNGVWDITTYWKNNYGTTTLPPGLSTSSSRYDVYLFELTHTASGTLTASLPAAAVSQAAVGGTAPGEKGTPQCYSGATLPTYDRRVLYVAIVNCTNLGITGNSGTPFAPVAYGKFFLTEPVSNGDYYSELIGLVGTGATIDPGDGSENNSVNVSESVQLYR